ncbi:hypothetical protein ACPPVO_44725 [Dactylosporangium sp. McL0621]|uniref:hypothetical protein n=1 Tax=Dactylosporangium sp. McL0621 TaxID=3415678 RepID=UPI003CF98644
MTTTPVRALHRLAWRDVRRGGLAVAVVAGGVTGLVAATYEQTVRRIVDPAALAALAANPAVRTLFGPPVLDDPGGFTVWRTGPPLGVLLGVWAILTVTRIGRGAEEAGRWTLLLAGRVPLATVVAGQLAVVATVAVLAGAAAAGALVLAGTALSGAVLHGAGLALTGICFAATATVAAQVLPTRSAATGAAVALLAAAVLARMAGDGVPGLAGLRWITPFGLAALARPYRTGTALPLLVLAAAVAVLAVAGPLLAARRDAGGSLLRPRGSRPPRRRTVRSLPGFAVRRLLPPLAGWAAGLVPFSLLVGLLAGSMTRFLAGNTAIAELAGQAGFGGLARVTGYTAVLYALLANPIGAFCVVRLTAVAADETAGRLTLLLAAPVTRVRYVAVETAATAAGATGLAAAAGVAAGAGAGLPPGQALAGALNALPVALLSLGAAVFALGWAPGWVAGLGLLPTAGGFLLLTLARSAGAPPWVVGLSPFAHLAPVPDTGPDIPATAIMLTAAAALIAVGAAGYRRRDLRR